jgi:hypothetical protein
VLLFVYDANDDLAAVLEGPNSSHWRCVGGDPSFALDANACFYDDPDMVGFCDVRFGAPGATTCGENCIAGSTSPGCADSGTDAGVDAAHD